MNIDELTLKHFEGIISDEPMTSITIHYNQLLVMHPGTYSSTIEQYVSEKLTVKDLNKTFYDSWSDIKNRSRLELLFDQIRHYISTYGSNFQDIAYIPAKHLSLPKDLRILLIQPLTEKEVIAKCKTILLGTALKQETMEDIINILKYLDTSIDVDEINNREAVCYIASNLNIYPTEPVELLRVLIYESTQESLLIKSSDLIEAIKLNARTLHLTEKQQIALAKIFNRFKPLFLAFKTNPSNRKVINRISKLSKIHHKPMWQNPLNTVTSRALKDSDISYITTKASKLQILRAMNACKLYAQGYTVRTYKIRNGTSWTKSVTTTNTDLAVDNYIKLVNILRRISEPDKGKIYIPSDVDYGLPLSEKSFLGSIPFGTKFFGNDLSVGIYWKNEWGADDLDLSAININGKVGWNSNYSQANTLIYSGDITSALYGAVEYLKAQGNFPDSNIKVNIYYGNDDCRCKVILGDSAKVNDSYMMNLSKLKFQFETTLVQKQTTLGIITHIKNKPCFVVTQLGSEARTISTDNGTELDSIDSIKHIVQYSLSLSEILPLLGYTIVNTPDEADIDLSLDKITTHNFIDLLV